ncbi:hypothetical protein [Peribacillus butanolivorans]
MWTGIGSDGISVLSGMLFYKELKNIKRIILISGIGISIMDVNCFMILKKMILLYL